MRNPFDRPAESRPSPERDLKERVKIIEKYPGLPANHKVELLSLIEGVKPAALFYESIKDSDIINPERRTRYERRIIRHENFLQKIGLPFVSRKMKVAADKNLAGYEITYFLIGKDKISMDRLDKAHTSNNTIESGLALGYSPTAVEAFLYKEGLRREDMRKKLGQNDLLKFVYYVVSADHLDQDLELAQKEMVATKKLSPKIFEEILRDKRYG